jgi:hypothetical protein
MHAFWSRGQVDVECVIDGIYESVEGGGILLALRTSDFDMSSVSGVHCVGCRWLTAGGGHPKDNSCTLFGPDGWMLYTQ